MAIALAVHRARSAYFEPPRKRLCLSQSAYELHELSAGERPAPDDLVLRHLRKPSDIDGVRFLRSQIDLSHSAGNPRFEAEEKKEMNSVSPSHSNWKAKLSAPCARFLSAINSRSPNSFARKSAWHLTTLSRTAGKWAGS
jgi:hypothetical protein